MAEPCPNGGEIIDYALGLCSCGKCAPAGDVRRGPKVSLYVRIHGDEWFAESEGTTPRNAASLFAEDSGMEHGEIDVIRATEAAEVDEDYDAEEYGWPLVPVKGDRWLFRVVGDAGEVEEAPRG